MCSNAISGPLDRVCLPPVLGYAYPSRQDEAGLADHPQPGFCLVERETGRRNAVGEGAPVFEAQHIEIVTNEVLILLGSLRIIGLGPVVESIGGRVFADGTDPAKHRRDEHQDPTLHLGQIQGDTTSKVAEGRAHDRSIVAHSP